VCSCSGCKDRNQPPPINTWRRPYWCFLEALGRLASATMTHLGRCWALFGVAWGTTARLPEAHPASSADVRSAMRRGLERSMSSLCEVSSHGHLLKPMPGTKLGGAATEFLCVTSPHPCAQAQHSTAQHTSSRVYSKLGICVSGPPRGHLAQHHGRLGKTNCGRAACL
jgi:hypothetical protein